MSEKYILKRGDKTFTPSKYQMDILRFAHEGVGNGFINACAGSSKTTMLENIIYQVPNNKKKVFIAFNKSIVSEMNNRIDSESNNLHVTTYHSLGYSILKENFPHKQFIVNEDKYVTYLRENIQKLSNYGETASLGKSFCQYFKNIVHLINYARYYHRSNILGIKNIGEKYGLNLLRDECVVCKNILDWGRENINVIDFTDMVWLVNELNLTTKKYLYDILLIDEAQDTSIMQQQMTERCKKRGSRTFVVGDYYQSINVWCGSDFDAVEKYKGGNVTEFELPISYRCPKAVVEMAKRYSPNIVASENAIDGEIRYNVSVNDPIGDDMVLCRHTAPLIEQFQKYLRINKKCYMKGSEEILQNLHSLITSMGSKFIDKNCMTCDGLIPKLFELVGNNIKNLLSKGYSEDDAYSHISVLNLYDSINSIRVLSDNLTTTEELLNKISDIFKDRSSEGVMLSTIHKAKGLEADNVYILYPSLIPNKFAKTEWEIKSEDHLIYVAYTRAKKTLNFMEEDMHHTKIGAAFNYKKMVNEIKNISQKLKFNIDNNVKEENLNNSLKTNIYEIGQKVSTNINTSKKKKTVLSFDNLF